MWMKWFRESIEWEGGVYGFDSDKVGRGEGKRGWFWCYKGKWGEFFMNMI